MSCFCDFLFSIYFTWQSRKLNKKREMTRQHDGKQKENKLIFLIIFSVFFTFFSQTEIQWTWFRLSLSDNIERLWWMGETLSVIFAEIDTIYRHLKWTKLNIHCLWHQIKFWIFFWWWEWHFFIMICIIFIVNYL